MDDVIEWIRLDVMSKQLLEGIFVFYVYVFSILLPVDGSVYTVIKCKLLFYIQTRQWKFLLQKATHFFTCFLLSVSFIETNREENERIL